MRAAAGFKHKAVVAIGAIDKAIRTNGEVNARVALLAAIAGDAAFSDFRGRGGGAVIGGVAHARIIARVFRLYRPNGVRARA